MNVPKSSELVICNCVDKKGIHFFIQDLQSRMCWQKLCLFILVQKRVFITISGRTVLRIHCKVGKHFGCFQKYRVGICDVCRQKKRLHFIRDIPTCIVLTKIRFDQYGCWNEFLSPYDSNSMVNFRGTVLLAQITCF